MQYTKKGKEGLESGEQCALHLQLKQGFLKRQSLIAHQKNRQTQYAEMVFTTPLPQKKYLLLQEAINILYNESLFLSQMVSLKLQRLYYYTINLCITPPL